MNWAPEESRIEQKFDRTITSPKVLPFTTPAPLDNDKRLTTIPTEITSVGRNDQLLRLRERLLNRIGLRVRSVQTEGAEIMARSPKTRLWLFCSTVELGELVYLASSVHRYSPMSRLVLIEGPRPVRFQASLFDRVLQITDGIETLVEAVSELAVAA